MSKGLSSHLEIVSPSDCPDAWDEYVDAHPKGSIFHTSAMFRVYEETPNHEPFARAAVDKQGNLVALLPAVLVSTLSGVARFMASRSICYAEPICDPTPQGHAGLTELLRVHDADLKHQALLAEVRPLLAPDHERQPLVDHGYQHAAYLNYVVDLSTSADEAWQRLSKSCRKKINKSQRRGVDVVIDNSSAGIERMYPLVAASYQRSKVPLAGIELFHAALKHLPRDVVQIRTATYQGEDVAAGIGLYHRDRFYAWYGGTLRLTNLVPFDCLTWDEIRWSCEQGGNLYDFGGAGSPDVEYGPRKFKAKFGGELVDYGRYTKVFSPLRLSLAKSTFRLVRGLLTK